MSAAAAESEPSFSSTSEHFSEVFPPHACIICHQRIEETSAEKVTLGEKGSNAINNVSKDLQDTIHAEAGDLVHRSCRGSYINKKVIQAKLKEKKNGRSLRKRRQSRTSDELDSLPLCLFCDKGNKCLSKGRGTLVPVRTMQFQQTVMCKCENRGDPWAQKVRAKIEFVQDCFASDTVYHNICYTNFRSGLQIPKVFMDEEPQQKKSCVGRREDKIRHDAFDQVIAFLDSLDAVQITVKDLTQVMQTVLENSGCDAYSAPYLKSKLIEHYGDKIVFAQSSKKADVITLKQTADSILRDFHKGTRFSDPEAEKMRLIKTVASMASLIKHDISLFPASRDVYPDTEAMTDHVNFVPESLRQFLQQVTKKDSDLKISAFGQAIIQCNRPNSVIAPLQIGLAVQVHRPFGSRFLIDTLSHLGFSTSYTEVRKFELNAAQSCGVDLPLTTERNTIQFIADNVDHNSVILDGRNTFHGMGMMATVTPGVKTRRTIPRQEISLKDIKAIGQIGIYFYRSDWKGLSALTFKEIPAISSNDDTFNLDLLWKIPMPLKSPCPAWSGMMQMVQDGEHPGKSSFIFLPMIDMSSSDVSCIYSTLKFVCCQAQKNRVSPIVTFDQPLFYKSLAIISCEKEDSELKNIVLRLGAFHLQMSFLGAIGHLIAGSGLQEMLEIPFAPNAVVHILNGKAYSRAVRAHLLTDSALNTLLTADAFQLPQILFHPDEEEAKKEKSEESVSTHASLTDVLGLPLQNGELCELLDEDLGDDTLNTAQNILDNLLKGCMSAGEAANHEVFAVISDKLEQHKEQSFHYNHSYVAKVMTFSTDNTRSVADEDFFSRHIMLEVISHMILVLSEDGYADPNKVVEKARMNQQDSKEKNSSAYRGEKHISFFR